MQASLSWHSLSDSSRYCCHSLCNGVKSEYLHSEWRHAVAGCRNLIPELATHNEQDMNVMGMQMLAVQMIPNPAVGVEYAAAVHSQEETILVVGA